MHSQTRMHSSKLLALWAVLWILILAGVLGAMLSASYRSPESPTQALCYEVEQSTARVCFDSEPVAR